MSRKGINDVELGEAGNGILRSLQCSSKRLVVVSGERKTGIQTKFDNIGKINHDFRASLNIIIGFAELLLNEVPGKINAEQRRSLNDILNNGKRLLHLANDILEQYEIEPVKKH
jgi:signal transduction histidine kinase